MKGQRSTRPQVLELLVQIAPLYVAGTSLSALARLVRLDRSTVRHHLRKAGLVPPRRRAA